MNVEPSPASLGEVSECSVCGFNLCDGFNKLYCVGDNQNIMLELFVIPALRVGVSSFNDTSVNVNKSLLFLGGLASHVITKLRSQHFFLNKF